MNEQSTTTRKPSHRIFVVTGEGDTATWTEIGAAWPHRDGKGFSINGEAASLQGPHRHARYHRTPRQGRSRGVSRVHATLDWQGITLSVGFTPNYCGADVHHIEIHVVTPVGARLPVTETGYRSLFFIDDVEQYGGPSDYARAWLDAAAQSPAWRQHQEQARQLPLF